MLKAREHRRMGGMLEGGGGDTRNYEDRSTIKLHALCIAGLSVIQLNIPGCNVSGFAIYN